MTAEQFRELLMEFFNWTSKTERPKSSWFNSLGTWAESKYNESVREEHKSGK